MSRRIVVAALAAAVISIPARAGAEDPSAPAPVASASAVTPPAGKAKATVKIRVGHLHKGRALIMSRVPVIGTLAPFVRHQKVEVSFFLGGDKLVTKTAKVRKGRGDYGVFRSRIRLRKGGKYAASARHVANAKLGPDRTIRKDWKARYVSLSYGECGRVVKGFKAAMRDLGYIANGGECLRGKTARGVLAYRKVNRMSRNLHAGKRLVKLAFLGRGAYRVRHPSFGEHVEVPLSKQVLVFANGDKPVAIYPISSGKPSTPTIQGHFNFYSSTAGYNAEGMYYSRYFYGGYAIHGYASVPNYPASHGCIRTYIADQPEIYERISIGEDIFVF
jgi:hypothetical protein